MNYEILKTELTKPAYAELSDADVVEKLNAQTVIEAVDSVAGAEVFAAVDNEEYTLLSAEEKSLFHAVILMPGVSPSDPKLVAMFGDKGKSKAALEKLQTRNTSLAKRLGLGTIREGHVQQARAMSDGK